MPVCPPRQRPSLRQTPAAGPPELERIGDRDLGQWPTRAGQHLVAAIARVVIVLGRVWRWSLANLALVLTTVIGGAIVLGATVLSAEVYEAVVENDGLAALGEPVLEAAVNSRTPASEQWVTHFTDLGGTVGMPLIAAAIVITLAVRRRSWLPVVLMLIAAAGSVLITVLGKDLTARARPPVIAVPPLETSPSFPSGHTLNATVVLGLSAYLVMLGRRHLRSRILVASVVVVFVVAMGLSRVWLGHRVADRCHGGLARRPGLARRGHHRPPGQGDPRPGRAGPAGGGEGVTQDAGPDSTARAASSRATGTRNGEHET